MPPSPGSTTAHTRTGTAFGPGSGTARVPRVTGRLATLVEEIRAVVALGLPPDVTARLVGKKLTPQLGAADLLTSAQCQGDPDHYRQHLLHAEDDGSFSLVALVWLPGQCTPVHDHVAWCVTGVHTGEEHERRYRLLPAAAPGRRARLVATEDVVNAPGAVCGFAPPGDIHRVRNGGTRRAISLHVYGADVSRLGSSVRRVYDVPADA
ncbi:cysteine dioxygenase family protein [Streptomyces sp. JJ66]|uniref:cysteine dioxygenase family protein n=1 Tax=Streptomyces sp. JJ66 TaxID=2803843 RepID=UPI001C5A3C2A|nr:cysteine dioxygenase family protein [Streptomyces sp. JJ66]MBW1604554.1 cysteine dioxygenase family protein [Streptomyces sp. JJ66]